MQPMLYSKPLLVAARGGTNNAAQEPPSSLQDLVRKFYTYLNNRDVRRLEKLFDPACVIEDEAYYQPLEGQVIKIFNNIYIIFSSIIQNK